MSWNMGLLLPRSVRPTARRGSSLAALLDRLDEVAESVGRRDQRVDLVIAHRRNVLVHHGPRLAAQLLEGSDTRFVGAHEHRAPVVGIALACDPPAFLEASHQQRDRGLGQALELRQLGDAPWTFPQRVQKARLGAGDVALTAAPEEPAEEPDALRQGVGQLIYC